MALPKTLREIMESLARIEAKLGTTPQGEGRGYLWTNSPQMPAETPQQVAERLQYDTYTAKEVLERVASLTPEERMALHRYERANKNRVTVVDALKGE